jgi:hypothetical protein
MKRLGLVLFWSVGALAVGYLALYGYAMFTGRDLQPGDPIHIFRKPDAPSYSLPSRVPDAVQRVALAKRCTAEPGPHKG